MDAAKYRTIPFQYKLARFNMILLEAYPFLGEVCMRVEKYTNDLHGFAATDGYRLYLNENKMNDLPEETLNFILLHELLHIVLYHRYPKDITYHEKILWNISFDLVVNWLILKMEYDFRYKNIPIIPDSNTFLCSDDLSKDPSHKIASAFIQQAYQQGVLSEHPPLLYEITWKSFTAQILNTTDFIFDIIDISENPNAPTQGEIISTTSFLRKKRLIIHPTILVYNYIKHTIIYGRLKDE
ncbi:MAG: hypothetical protein FWD38_09090 [Oscillospiraceae bacterium]|nr:hypothetical protein [Oscillospiraceae bacterium]